MPKASKETRIKKRYDKMMQIYFKLPKNKLDLAEPLIKQCAFMEVALEDLSKLIAQHGVTEEYKNGKEQIGIKQSAEVQAYNATSKSYNTIHTRLVAMLPDDVAESKLDKFLSEE